MVSNSVALTTGENPEIIYSSWVSKNGPGYRPSSPLIRLRFEIGQFVDTDGAILVDALPCGDAGRHGRGALRTMGRLLRLKSPKFGCVTVSWQLNILRGLAPSPARWNWFANRHRHQNDIRFTRAKVRFCLK